MNTETMTVNKYNDLLPPTEAEDREASSIGLKGLVNDMESRLVESFVKGRNGWNRPALCSDFRLLTLLESAIINGDIVDIANFTMFLHARGHRNIQALRDARDRSELGQQIATLTELERTLIDAMGTSNDQTVIATLDGQLQQVVHLISQLSERWYAVNRQKKGA